MSLREYAMTPQVLDRAPAGDGGFSAMKARLAAAASADPATTRVAMSFAGKPVALTLIGKALAGHMLTAFAHLIDKDAPPYPGRSFEFWDCAASDAPMPPAPLDGEWESRSRNWRISLHGDGRYLCEARQNSITYLDRATGTVLAAFRSSGHLSLADRARPLQRMMSQVCPAFGIQDIHGSLVSSNRRGALIVGGSGRGKTTTSIDGLAGGLDFLGDDSVGLGEADCGFAGYSLYNSARVHPQQVARWPNLAGRWREPAEDDDKSLLVPTELAPGRVARQTGIAAILVPVIDTGRFAVAPTSPLLAFNALVHDSKDNRRFGMNRTEFMRLTKLTKSVPCFRCELDRDPLRMAAGLSDLLGSLGS
jgi:hypothetical protein